MPVNVGHDDVPGLSVAIMGSWSGMTVVSPSRVGTMTIVTSPENNTRSGEISSKRMFGMRNHRMAEP